MFSLRPRRIFLDYASTTPMLPAVRKAMEKYWSDDFYNPSAFYQEGRSVRGELEKCRTEVARILGAGRRDIVFTAGGTEANNIAVMGAFESARAHIKTPHLIVSGVEHSSILETAHEVERRGGRVSIAPVGEDGTISPDEVMELVTSDTFLISVMLANNELGTVEPISTLGRLVRKYRESQGSGYPYFHTDASHGPNYLSVHVDNLQVDLMSLDGSKIYGPKEIGVLVVRPGAELRATTFGGSQERGLRSGTESMALIAGFTKALTLAQEDRESESLRLAPLRDLFIREIEERLPQVLVHKPKQVLPNIISVSVPGVLAEFLVLALDKEGVMTSVGSACHAVGASEGSEVIRAIGHPELAESTVRFSLGRFTTRAHVERAVESFSKIVNA